MQGLKCAYINTKGVDTKVDAKMEVKLQGVQFYDTTN